METPLQSEKVREKAYQLCREYLQVKILSNHLIVSSHPPGLMEVSQCEAT